MALVIPAIDKNALKSKVVAKGYKVDEFIQAVKKTGVTFNESAYYDGLNGRREFDRGQIRAISEVLELTESEILDIFF